MMGRGSGVGDRVVILFLTLNHTHCRLEILNSLMALQLSPLLIRLLLHHSRCAHTLYETEVVTPILDNSESWIGISAEAIDKLQNFQIGLCSSVRSGSWFDFCSVSV